jgi:hypothetical protein
VSINFDDIVPISHKIFQLFSNSFISEKACSLFLGVSALLSLNSSCFFSILSDMFADTNQI